MAPSITEDDLAVLFLEVEVGWERAQSRFVRFRGFDAAWDRAEAAIARAHAEGREVDGASVWALIAESDPEAPDAVPDPGPPRGGAPLAPVVELRPRDRSRRPSS